MKQTVFDYWNTTGETGEVLDDYRDKALKQQLKVMAFFRVNRHRGFTSYEIKLQVFPPRGPELETPMSSVTRAISNLKAAGILVSGGKKKGPYGRNVNIWILNPNLEPDNLSDII